MFCPSCGLQVPDIKARFCNHCGKPLLVPGAAAVVAAPVMAVPSSAPRAHVAPVFHGPVYAGFWKRTAAFILDTLIVTLLGFVAGFVVGFSVAVLGGRESIVQILSPIVGGIIGIAYFIVLESSEHQATWGKRALGIVVTDLSGRRIGGGRAAGRYFGKILSGLALCIGYIMAGFTERKQGLHDMMAGTLVVNREAVRHGALDGASAPSGGLSGGAIALIVVAVLAVPFIGGVLAAIAIPAYQDYISRAKAVETYTYGLAAAHIVGEYYEQHEDVPDTLEAVGYVAPPGYTVNVNPANGVVSATSESAQLTLQFIPSVSNGKVQWRCDPGKLSRSKTGSVCQPHGS